MSWINSFNAGNTSIYMQPEQMEPINMVTITLADTSGSPQLNYILTRKNTPLGNALETAGFLLPPIHPLIEQPPRPLSFQATCSTDSHIERFLEIGVQYCPELTEIEDELRQKLGIQSRLSKAIALAGWDDFELYKEQAINAQKQNDFSAINTLINMISERMDRATEEEVTQLFNHWEALIYKMEEENPMRMEALQVLYNHLLTSHSHFLSQNERASTSSLIKIIQLACLLKLPELNHWCASYVGWPLEQGNELDFRDIPYERLLPILNKFRSQESKLAQFARVSEQPASTSALQSHSIYQRPTPKPEKQEPDHGVDFEPG